MTTFVDSGLDADERVIVETAADFAAKRIAPHALRWDADNHFPVAELREDGVWDVRRRLRHEVDADALRPHKANHALDGFD